MALLHLNKHAADPNSAAVGAGISSGAGCSRCCAGPPDHAAVIVCDDEETNMTAQRRTAAPALSRLQLSLLNSGLLPIHEDDRLQPLVPSGPLEAQEYLKHVALLRKYEVLARIEYQVGACKTF